VFDPDEEVRRAVTLFFARFRIAGSIADVIKHFAGHGLRFPAHYGKRVEWSRLTRSRAHQILANPMYAGAYVFGRARGEIGLEDGVRRRRVRQLPRSEWPVMIRDAHPVYIPWEEYLANEKRMSENATRRRGTASRGAVREGRALLQGMLLCDHCGGRLNVRYSGQNGRYSLYQCGRLNDSAIGGFCSVVRAPNLDEPIVDLVFGLLTQPNLLDATRVVEVLDEQHASLDRQWTLRLERARYDAKRAERQYDACDPDNRVVARALEKRWNERLTEVERLEREYDEFKRARRFELSDVDRRRVLQLATDLPRLWHAKTTEDRDRKLLLRLLIKDISVRAVDVPRPTLHVKVLWHTHAVTELEVERPGRGAGRRKLNYAILRTTAPVARTNQQSAKQ
jgi:hypothetical protein